MGNGRLRMEWGLALAGAVLWAAAAQGVTFYVAANGNDGWSGRQERPNAAGTDGPLASLTGARNAIRRLRAGGAGAGQAVTVVVGEGHYALAGPLVLEPQDSGTADAPVTYTAAPGAKPVFSGGRRISGFRIGGDGLWRAAIPQVRAGAWYFEQLWVDGRRAVRARSPNKFYYYVQNVVEQKLAAGQGRGGARARQVFTMRREDIEPLLALDKRQLADVTIKFYHKWDNTTRFVDAVDPASNSLISDGGPMKSWNPLRRNSRYHIENFRSALDAAGEWFLARDGVLYYKPLPGQRPERAEVVAPAVERFIVIKGDAAAGRFVEHVVIKGLSFSHSQYLTPPSGFEPSQAASPIDAVVLADAARNVTIEACEFSRFGRYGVWFRKGCTDCVLKKCYIYDGGAGGVRIGETSIAKDRRERTGRITVENNIIRSLGRIFPCAVGVWIGQSGQNNVSHNEIADLFYTGISVGWRWGYSESLAKGNQIRFNHVHHIGQGVLSDMGGIYTLGPSEGTVIANNVFHHVYAYSYGGWGLYTDEGSTGIVMEKNLVYDVKTGGFHQHYGKENIVRNNILAFSELYQVQATRVEEHLSFTFENNIVYYDRGVLLSGPWTKVRIKMDRNCYWDASGREVSFVGKSLEDWCEQTGHDCNSIIADPLFADPQGRDFRLKADSPVLKLGFEPFDYSKAGVYGEPAWIEKARSAEYPPLEIAPDPPPIAILDDFESSRPGSGPAGAEVHTERKGDSIAVTAETAAAGRQSLKFTDAAGLEHAFNPHVVYRPNHAAGTSRCSFYLKLGPGVRFNHEWRDWRGSPYDVGPSLWINGTKLQVRGRTLMEVPLGRWFGLEVTAALQNRHRGSWSLKVTLPDGPTRRFEGLKNGTERFEKLTWLGFISNATDRSVFYLDKLSITNSAPPST